MDVPAPERRQPSTSAGVTREVFSELLKEIAAKRYRMSTAESRTLRECAVQARGIGGAGEFAPSAVAYTGAAALAVFGALRFGQFVRASVATFDSGWRAGQGRGRVRRLGMRMGLFRGLGHLSASLGSLAAAYALWSFDRSSGAFAGRRERADVLANACLQKIVLLSVNEKSLLGGEAAALLYARDPDHPVLRSVAREVMRGAPAGSSGAGPPRDIAAEEQGWAMARDSDAAGGRDSPSLRQVISTMPRLSSGARRDRPGETAPAADAAPRQRRGPGRRSSDDAPDRDDDADVMQLLRAGDTDEEDLPASASFDEVERRKRMERREQIIKRRRSRRRGRQSRMDDDDD